MKTAGLSLAPSGRRLRGRPWPWLIVGGLVVIGLVGLAVFARRAQQAQTQVRLDRELALAVDARDVHSVREIARRLALQEDVAERHRRLAEVFLALRMFTDLDDALADLVRTSLIRPRVVDRFRAQAAMAREDWIAAIAEWEAYLRLRDGLPPEERAAALDQLVSALLQAHQWQQARRRLDERLALGDAVEARLSRAIVLVRVREWSAAEEDFQHLRRTAPSEATVKVHLPRWERIERSLGELIAGDQAVNANPAAAGPRIDRALTSARAGLWQNAAEDLAAVTDAAPTARLPALMLQRLFGLPESRTLSQEIHTASDALPCLATGEQALIVAENLNSQLGVWRALRACDQEIAETSNLAGLPALLAEQARLECELGGPRQALRDARDALQKSPALLPAQRVEIMALFAMNDFVAADAKTTIAMHQQADAAGRVHDAELVRLAGLVWQAQGKHEQAVTAFSAWLDTERRADVLRARAKSRRFLQYFSEAKEDLAEAEALDAAKNKTP